jgi:hypothetical protein
MSAKNPLAYYENVENHGSYAYETLNNMVNNFMQIYTGNGTVLGPIKRYQVLFWMKKGIQMFTADALKEPKAVELELGDALDAVMPPDYVDYIRVSWLNEKTGDLMPMAKNYRLPLATAYLQDHKANILFDDNGYVLEGDSAANTLNDDPNKRVPSPDVDCNAYPYYGSYYQNFRIDTSINYNGTFIESKSLGKFHFDSSVSDKIIVLEYVSDGLEHLNDDQIKVNKYAEYALYNWVNWNILNNKNGVADYERRRAKRDYDTAYRNAKIKLLGIKIAEISQMVKKINTWVRG